jgi:hypothetical protein
MVLLIKLYELCCVEVGEQKIRCSFVGRDIKTEMMKGSSGSLGLAIVGYFFQVQCVWDYCWELGKLNTSTFKSSEQLLYIGILLGKLKKSL